MVCEVEVCEVEFFHRKPVVDAITRPDLPAQRVFISNCG
jgi:hypothetical protein